LATGAWIQNVGQCFPKSYNQYHGPKYEHRYAGNEVGVPQFLIQRKIFEETTDNRKREECAQCAAFDYKTNHQYLELQFHFFIVSVSEDDGDSGDTI